MRRPRSRLAAAVTRRCRWGNARMMRVNHDYHRRGAVAYLAAYDVHARKIHGLAAGDTTGIVPFTADGRAGHDPGA